MLNAHASLVTKVGAATLKDIEGLDADTVGFARAECCAPLPPKLPGSFEALLRHAFLATSVPAPQWDKTCTNVRGFEAFQKAMKALPKSAATAYYDDGLRADASLALLFSYDESDQQVIATQYSGTWDPTQLPWEANTHGVIATDRSAETFIFVCSHRRRDDRCGYCGPMLVDCIRQAVAERMPKGADAVHVYPCSHVGGHVYAGNVLVYHKKGGVCFGCFCPSDIPALLDSIRDDANDIPVSLVERVRGRMGASESSQEVKSCAMM